jgi:hypothetical protein
MSATSVHEHMTRHEVEEFSDESDVEEMSSEEESFLEEKEEEVIDYEEDYKEFMYDTKEAEIQRKKRWDACKALNGWEKVDYKRGLKLVSSEVARVVHSKQETIAQEKRMKNLLRKVVFGTGVDPLASEKEVRTKESSFLDQIIRDRLLESKDIMELFFSLKIFNSAEAKAKEIEDKRIAIESRKEAKLHRNLKNKLKYGMNGGKYGGRAYRSKRRRGFKGGEENYADPEYGMGWRHECGERRCVCKKRCLKVHIRLRWKELTGDEKMISKAAHSVEVRERGIKKEKLQRKKLKKIRKKTKADKEAERKEAAPIRVLPTPEPVPEIEITEEEQKEMDDEAEDQLLIRQAIISKISEQVEESRFQTVKDADNVEFKRKEKKEETEDLLFLASISGDTYRVKEVSIKATKKRKKIEPTTSEILQKAILMSLYKKGSQAVERRNAHGFITNKEEQKSFLFKTKMCKSIMAKRKCYHKVCRFAHHPSELKKSKCRFGIACSFVKERDGLYFNKGKDKKNMCRRYHDGETEENFGCRILGKKVVAPVKKVARPYFRFVDLQHITTSAPGSWAARVGTIKALPIFDMVQINKARDKKARIVAKRAQVVICRKLSSMVKSYYWTKKNNGKKQERAAEKAKRNALFLEAMEIVNGLNIEEEEFSWVSKKKISKTFKVRAPERLSNTIHSILTKREVRFVIKSYKTREVVPTPVENSVEESYESKVMDVIMGWRKTRPVVPVETAKGVVIFRKFTSEKAITKPAEAPKKLAPLTSEKAITKPAEAPKKLTPLQIFLESEKRDIENQIEAGTAILTEYGEIIYIPEEEDVDASYPTEEEEDAIAMRPLLESLLKKDRKAAIRALKEKGKTKVIRALKEKGTKKVIRAPKGKGKTKVIRAPKGKGKTTVIRVPKGMEKKALMIALKRGIKNFQIITC